MNVRNSLHVRALQVFAAALLLSPVVSRAFSIGELTLHSRLGEPLLAQVELSAGKGERIEASCLSLAAPDAQDDDARSYLTRAALAIDVEEGRQFAVISSRNPFNELFAKVRLQIKCPGMGSVVKTLTILPDLELAPPAPVTAPEVEAEVPAGETMHAVRAKSAPPASVALPRPLRAESIPLQKPRATKKRRAAPVPVVRKEQGGGASFKLKLSGNPLDESRIGKISAEEREQLLAQQKLLDADDQTASFLALQHQVKQLQSELGEIRLKLAQLDAGALARPAGSAAPGSSPQASRPSAAQPQASDSASQRDLLILAGLLLAILALWQGLRRYSMARSKQAAATPILKHPDSFPAASEPDEDAPTLTFPAAGENETVVDAPHKPPPVEAAPPAQPVVAERPAPVERSAPPVKNQEALTEEDSMLEEAELYAIHGHPNKAVEILREIVVRNPSHVEAWLLMLSVFSARGNVAEFEKAARSFLAYNKNNSSWPMIQGLGRTLDKSNPLYEGSGNLGAAAMFLPQIAMNKRRAVGDILVEMGALSMRDLKSCLDSFNPKVHGRFGGYLITRKLITHAQLNEALLLQQSAETGEKRGILPTLQDMENLLAGFDPKQHGNVGEYLVAQKAITREQLDNMQWQQNPGAAPEASPAEGAAGQSQEEEGSFHWEEHREHDKLSRPREISAPGQSAGKSGRALPDFELVPLAPLLPEIDLNPENVKSSGKKSDPD